jgi:hypothetical protein
MLLGSLISGCGASVLAISRPPVGLLENYAGLRIVRGLRLLVRA